MDQDWTPVVLRKDNLSTKAQKTALKILNKEELNSKKSRMECLLIQQVFIISNCIIHQIC